MRRQMELETSRSAGTNARRANVTTSNAYEHIAHPIGDMIVATIVPPDGYHPREQRAPGRKKMNGTTAKIVLTTWKKAILAHMYCSCKMARKAQGKQAREEDQGVSTTKSKNG